MHHVGINDNNNILKSYRSDISQIACVVEGGNHVKPNVMLGSSEEQFFHLCSSPYSQIP